MTHTVGPVSAASSTEIYAVLGQPATATSPSPAALGSIASPRLPTELLELIRDFLMDDSCYLTLVSLACASKAMSELVGPCLPDPRRLVLGDENVDQVFADLLGCQYTLSLLASTSRV